MGADGVSKGIETTQSQAIPSLRRKQRVAARLDTLLPLRPPSTGKIAVKVINHYGDEVLKVYEV
jgi:hypothetical protein